MLINVVLEGFGRSVEEMLKRRDEGREKNIILKWWLYFTVGNKQASMEFNYSVEKEGGYLLIQLMGQYNETVSMSLPEFMLHACEKEKVNKILIDGLKGDWTGFETLERFSFGQKLAEVISSKIKIGVVMPQNSIDKFAETVARNRGVDLAVFSELAEAIGWLQKPIHNAS